MSLSEHVWAKVYLELPTDPKLVGRSAHDCYLWVCLILIAKGTDGIVLPWQAQGKYLSKYARISLREVAGALAYFEEVGMIRPTPDGGFFLRQFQKRQKKADPTAAERQRRKRDRERDGHGDVTRDSHDTRAHEEADRNPNGLLTEADADVDHPLSSPNGELSPKGDRRRPVLDEATALRDGAERGFSEADTRKHLQAWRDYGAQVGWRSKAGPWKDYNAAFRTWLSHERPGEPAIVQPGQRDPKTGLIRVAL